ncbi:uncharacterized protein (DUF4415 family) [Stella humosa]|uniref:Uncharacterized protein (DUF4415 family) n=1 Tax=Stella humosa TaxID=94 RepID=A0A3N1KXP0_9PROT|nr:BrnA antitoxin family protein [Stella humosa]ROP84017.1 uncharacterized protein (DUF4415 family) [Stella humosa]BBK33526.1 hypothetical protein STHU_41600 [Stella humosa]
MTGSKRNIGSDLAKVDAHVITAEEYEEIPELPDQFFAEAVEHRAGKPVKRGRPPSASPKELVHIRLSRQVVDAFRAGGPGWQTRINDTLEAAVRREKEGAGSSSP